VVTPHLILAMFLVAQACDGLFTYFAVQSYGIMAEGNVLLATWITLVGPGPALMGAKLLAAGCGVLLYHFDRRAVLLGLTVFYGLVAVGPWMTIFHQI
jgi:Domain of unknown function (DUF5658)